MSNAAYNLLSESVTVFPVVKRDAQYQVQSRLLTEQNLISIVNRLTDNDAFIISVTTNSDTEICEYTDTVFAADGNIKLVKLNIHGYYFELKNFLIVGASGNYIFETAQNAVYAYIRVDDSYNTIDSGDVTVSNVSKYAGLKFSGAEPTAESGYKIYSIKLFEKITTGTDAGKYKLCKDSFVKFNAKRLGFDCIDGGQI